jgi:drug/metabolite transporter (DMT)-like permease
MRLSIILAVTLWASTFVGIRAAVIDFTPVDIAVLRFIVSSILLIVISIFQKVSIPDIKSFLILVLIGVILFINYTALNYGTKSITAGETTLIVSTSNLFQVLRWSPKTGQCAKL